MYRALQYYSNVHRGSGQRSLITTRLYEGARLEVLSFLGLDPGAWEVIFGTRAGATGIVENVQQYDYHIIDSTDFNLPFGVCALAVRRHVLKHTFPFNTGGGTTRLYSGKWVIWTSGPELHEAGTPAIINVIGFARALNMITRYGRDIFLTSPDQGPADTGFLRAEEGDGVRGLPLIQLLRATMPGKEVKVPVNGGEAAVVHFDHSASTAAFQSSWEAFTRASLASGPVRAEILREVREILARFLQAPAADYDMMFTSGTTESINILARSMARSRLEGVQPVVLTTLLEHSSNELPWRYAEGLGVVRAGVDKEGFWDLRSIGETLRAYNEDHRFGDQRILLVAASGASNVLGSCNDLQALAGLVHRYGAYLMVDAAQLVAHREIRMKTWGIDFLTFSAHKVYAPFGAGVLAASVQVQEKLGMSLSGPCQEGEENLAGIAAMGRSLVLMERIGFQLVCDHEQEMTRRALAGLASLRGIQLYGLTDPDSPRFSERIGVLVFGIRRTMPGTLARALYQEHAIATRYGCHCAHLIVKYLANFNALGEWLQGGVVRMFPRLQLQGLLRISFGLENRTEEVDLFLSALRQCTGPSKTGASAAEKQDKRGKKKARKDVESRISALGDSVLQEVYRMF